MKGRAILAAMIRAAMGWVGSNAIRSSRNVHDVGNEVTRSLADQVLWASRQLTHAAFSGVVESSLKE